MGLTDRYDPLKAYLSEIRRYPLLDAASELRLATELSTTSDPSVAQQLVTANLRFVVKLCFEYRRYGLKMIDLIQEGNIGLMAAVRKFEPGRGVRLINYAAWWIRAYVQNFIISNWSLVKLGTTNAQKKLFFKLRQTRGALTETVCHNELIETARQLNVKPAEIAEMAVRLQGEAYLDAEMEDGSSFLSLVADTRPSQEELLAEWQYSQKMKQALKCVTGDLSEREAFIVTYRLSAEKPLTLPEIARHFCVSSERVRQIEVGLCSRLREKLSAIMHEQQLLPA